MSALWVVVVRVHVMGLVGLIEVVVWRCGERGEEGGRRWGERGKREHFC